MTPDWIRTAKIGDKVVCVDDSEGRVDIASIKYRLKIGAVYTLSEITMQFSEPAVSVDEIPSQYLGHDGFYYTGYMAAARFRPVEPRKTSIEVFTNLLITAPADNQMEDA